MTSVCLTLHASPALSLEAASIRPDAFADLDEAQIASLPAWHGKERVALGDFFRVEGGRSADVRLRGDLSRVTRLGTAMAGGRLVIEGPVGRYAGATMSGGVLRIEGDAGEGVGAEMQGGVIDVGGDAGARVGGPRGAHARGMTGGVILVRGSAGEAAGEWMRRGVIAVARSSGERAGAHMIAGTIVVCGKLGRRAGLDLRRGTIVAAEPVELLPTYRYASTYRPGFLALLFRSLEARDFAVAKRFRSGSFRKYGGDYAGLGRGEILEWTKP